MSNMERVTRELLHVDDRELKLISGAATHQHYKGGLYQLIGFPVMDSDTGEVLKGADGEAKLLYLHLYPYAQQYWVRTVSEWHTAVDTPEWHPAHGSAELIHRFRPIGQGWAR